MVEPIPKGDGKTRRLLTLSDEEVALEIDQRLPYRTGWPKLRALPLWSCLKGDPMSYVPDYEEHISNVRTILEVQRVVPKNIAICHRLHRDKSSKMNSSTVTLFITTEPHRGNAYMAVLRIRKYLASHSIDVAIEIMDERAQKPKTLPIQQSDTGVIEVWVGGLQESVVGLLDDSRLTWTSLNLFKRGLEGDECRPTVLISAADASDDAWWDYLLPSIRDACPTDWNVELTHSDRLVFDPYDDAVSGAKRLSVSTFKPEIEMGASCGSAGAMASGTYGGVIKLSQGGKSLGSFALSNHHVVLTDSLKQATTGYKPLEPTHALIQTGTLVVCSPSDRDTSLRLDGTANHLASLKSTLEGSGGRIGLREKVDMGDESKRNALNKVCESIMEAENEVAQIRAFARHAGFVYASSGYRVLPSAGMKEPWALDWSLTHLAAARYMENIIPKTSEQSPDGLPQGQQADAYSKSGFRGHKVAKLGRSSGWTTGTANYVTTVFSGVNNSYGRNVACWAVVPDAFPGYFAYPGDSGAVVLDNEPDSPSNGMWVGLLFAANLNDGYGFFVPIDVVLEDIHHVTGCDVAEPQLS